jgi:lipoyl synthase
LPVARFWEPAEFDDLAERGRRLGLRHVQSSPLTRSSYHAREALHEATPVAAPALRS